MSGNIEVGIASKVMNSQMFVRDQNLDIAKGIGILLVVWGHCSLIWFDEIYSFHMPLFFFLSGCVLNISKPYKDIVKRKANQLLIPYIFFVFLSCLFYWGLLFLTHRFSIDQLQSLIKSLFPYKNEIINTPLWFLLSLFWMSVIYVGIRKIVHREWLIFTIVMILYLAMKEVGSRGFILPFFLGRGLGEMIYMHLGYFLYKRKNYIFQLYELNMSYIVCLLFLSVIVFCSLFYLQKPTIDVLYDFILLFIAIAGISVIFMQSLLFKNLAKYIVGVLSYLGCNTLYIFAIHLPLLEFARPIGKYIVGGNGLLYDAVVFCSDLILSIALAWFLKYIKNLINR